MVERPHLVIITGMAGAGRSYAAKALEACRSFERGKTYVLCCEFGLMSAHLAEHMRRDGFEAYHLAGGQRALMRL